jgi:dipeptidyl aminopeptidase/acylaminoacyl peptidase
VTPDDIGALVEAAGPRVSPDGRLVAFVVRHVDRAANGYASRVWLAPADGSHPAEPVTSGGERRDADPVWSPDGRWLAFTSTRAGEKPTTIHLLPIGRAGETVALATHPQPTAGLAWSPDGRWLAFTSRTPDERYDRDESAQPPRRLRRLLNRLDDTGWVVDRPEHVHVVATVTGGAGTGVVRDLTPGEHSFTQPAWSADSRSLVAAGAAHDTWDLDLARDLYRIALPDPAAAAGRGRGADGAGGTDRDGAGGADRVGAPGPERLTDGQGDLGLPSVSPDGRRIAFLGGDDTRIDPKNSRIGVLDVATGERRWLDTGLDRTWHPGVGATAPVWLDDDRLLVVCEDRGDQHPYVVAVDGPGGAVRVLGGERVIGGVDAAAGTVAFTEATIDRPAEVVVARLDAGEAGRPAERRLSYVTDAFVAVTRPRPAERFTAGAADVDVWVFVPEGFDPAATHHYPALVNIHGGPFGQYGNRFYDEAQVQAGAGYVVVLSNPRGSSGREQSFARAIAGERAPVEPGTGWGSVDYEDVMAVTDEVLRRYPAVDPARLGVLGGSYGGYLTTWIVTRSTRFAAACSERAVNDLLALEASSDYAGAFWTIVGVEAHEDPEAYRRMSPITYVRDIRTPMLLIHSEQDLRCPIGQAEALFVALRRMGREVELVRFPAESHELSRSGAPTHRIQRAEIILEFFRRHLMEPRPEPRPDDAPEYAPDDAPEDAPEDAPS